jgi:hypothetical protein
MDDPQYHTFAAGAGVAWAGTTVKEARVRRVRDGRLLPGVLRHAETLDPCGRLAQMAQR